MSGYKDKILVSSGVPYSGVPLYPHAVNSYMSIHKVLIAIQIPEVIWQEEVDLVNKVWLCIDKRYVA